MSLKGGIIINGPELTESSAEEQASSDSQKEKEPKSDENPDGTDSPKTVPTVPSEEAKPTSDLDAESKVKSDEEPGEKPQDVTMPREQSEVDLFAIQGETQASDAKSNSSSTCTTPQPRGTDSGPKSCAGDDNGTDPKVKLRKRRTGTVYKVTFTVTISLAIPTVEDQDGPDFKDLVKKKKRVFEAPRPQNYYHLEYYLIPNSDELMKTDVVTYGVAAKVYMEKNEPKALKTWMDGDITWVAWSHSQTLEVTKELLLKMYSHTLELRLWDTKDKVGTRAKFDRPKLFKLPNIKQDHDVEELGGVKMVVLRQSQNFRNLQPKKGGETRPLPKEVTFQRPDYSKKKDALALDELDEKDKDERADSPTPHTLMAVARKDSNSADVRSSYSRLGRLAAQREYTNSEQGSRSRAGSSKKSQPPGSPISKASKDGDLGSPSHKRKSADSETSGSKNVRRKSRKTVTQLLNAAELIRKNGLCSVPIRLATLFAGYETVTNRLDGPMPGVEDLFVTLSLDRPLLSKQMQMELNPMIIKIHSVSNMPDSPASFDTLKERCMPSHCKYTFYKQPSHCTLKRPQASNIYWDDVNVVLAGTFDSSELRQFLNGPPMEIEVHDRDRKPEEVKLKATLFGDDLEDEKISNVGTVASRRTIHNPFKDRAKIWDPYGIAKLDLSDLLLGHKYLFLKVPIHNCPIPDVLGTQDKTGGKLVGLAGAVDGPVDSPMPAGHYLQSNAMLKVKIELAKPLISTEMVALKAHIPTTPECPFTRVIYIFEYKNTALLNQLQNLVTKINARALELDDMPQHVTDAALSTYKLSAQQQESRSLDIVTGFQVLDGTMHLFVLEGLRDKAIREIWDFLPKPQKPEVAVLFNSNVSFGERLYGPLDVDLCRIKLHEPLEQIVQQPLLYVRDMVPKPCFEALVRLHEMTKARNVNTIIRNELFPTANMVVSMSKEFGVPFTTEDFEELQPPSEDDRSMAEAEATTEIEEKAFVREHSKFWEPIDNLNISFMERLLDRERAGPDRDYIKNNMEDIKHMSDFNKREKAKTKPLTVKADVEVAHNYSSQSLNSTELAKEKLRQILAEDPDKRYTYCQDYLHSMTVVPVNVEALKKQEKAESEARWKTADGWIYPGIKSTLEANEHPRKVHVARQDELKERWKENILHVGVLQAPLDRDRWPWEARIQDFELYKKAPEKFGSDEPVTIHLAGEKLKQEKMDSLTASKKTWESKIVVGNTSQFFHRCLTETELRAGGRKSSNQVAKLQGLLKDQPQKLSLKKSGMSLKPVPPLNVVLNPSVDTDARLAGLSTRPAVPGEGVEKTKGYKPGPFEDRSWAFESNKIPATDYQHHRYKEKYGGDFNVYHRENQMLWKRPIYPLEEEERDNHLFMLPGTGKRFPVLPGVAKSSIQRSATEPQIEVLPSVKLPDQKTEPVKVTVTSSKSVDSPSLTTVTTHATGLGPSVKAPNTLTAVVN